MDSKILKAAEVLFELAYAEDIGSGDITTNSIIQPADRKTAVFVAKENGVVAGLPVAEMVFRELDETLEWNVKKQEGEEVQKGEILVEFKASYRALLTGERIALNFVQRLSGIASATHVFVNEVKDFHVQILDTRKTLPGFRLLDKYAVKTGGATNHRMGLHDMVMIKDNHIQVAGGIKPAVEAVKLKMPVSIKIEVETTTLDEVKQALEAGADIIMLDNMSTEMLAEAVKLIGEKAKTEASGNMSLERLREVAATGVNFISIGSLTHSVKALDISQRIID
jgi:nicotinate-nucleotide pyrophosphorylase (carboxylating)